mmetsp:Transcript_2001/g.12754  ORF Transcript_2001/g.12754 Transcript_2001/m.12754 type:complete len:254 (-) Transcript_2001:2124-2885(-)
MAGEPSHARTERRRRVAYLARPEPRTRTRPVPSRRRATAACRHLGRPLRRQRPTAQDMRVRGSCTQPAKARPGRLRSTCSGIHGSRGRGRDARRDVPATLRLERSQVSQPQAHPRDRGSLARLGHGHRRRAQDKKQRIHAMQRTTGWTPAQTDRKLGRARAELPRARRLGVRIRTLDDLGGGGAQKRRKRMDEELRNYHRTGGAEVGQKSHRRSRIVLVHRHPLPKSGRNFQTKSERGRIPRQRLHLRTQCKP